MALQEAMQLAETHAGEPCTFLAAGSARGFLRQPSTFFGSGTVDEVKSLCSLRDFQMCGPILITSAATAGTEGRGVGLRT